MCRVTLGQRHRSSLSSSNPRLPVSHACPASSRIQERDDELQLLPGRTMRPFDFVVVLDTYAIVSRHWCRFWDVPLLPHFSARSQISPMMQTMVNAAERGRDRLIV